MHGYSVQRMLPRPHILSFQEPCNDPLEVEGLVAPVTTRQAVCTFVLI